MAAITKERVHSLGLTLLELEALSDIDYAEDWEKHGAPFILGAKDSKSVNES